MVKSLSHDDWVRQQFKKFLRRSYRDVLVHSSIIEGTLRNETGERWFSDAIKALQKSGRITSSEFDVFDAVRDTRNRLVHDSFKDGLVQNQIDGLRDKLIEKILEAYKISRFLDKALFLKYNIVRGPTITFTPK